MRGFLSTWLGGRAASVLACLAIAPAGCHTARPDPQAEIAVLIAEQDLRAAQARAIEIERQAAVALLRLQRAVGGPGVAASLISGSSSSSSGSSP